MILEYSARLNMKYRQITDTYFDVRSGNRTHKYFKKPLKKAVIVLEAFFWKGHTNDHKY